MKNTLKNKAKFFAQYWGQNVLMTQVSDSKNGMRSKVIGTIEDYIKDTYIELKSLSSISNEDADFICGFLTMSDFQLLTCEFGVDFENISCSYWDFIEVLDYLRSRGYALPWNGFLVENQVDFGWVKIKS